MNAYETLVLSHGRRLEGHTIYARSLTEARTAARALEPIYSCYVIITHIRHGGL